MNLIFLDLETTGLDEATGEILEIGMLAVNPRNLQELAAWSTPVNPSSGFYAKMDPRVVEMHTASGLLEELRGPRSYTKLEAGGLPGLAQAEAWAIACFDNWGGATVDGKSPLCGSNPGFDRRWLRRWMPALEQRFLYRDFDSNFTFQLARFVFGQDTKKEHTHHRALADCRQSVQTIRTFLGGGPA